MTATEGPRGALSARGERWAVATPHPLASEAAARAFAAGGTAVDAALHAATTLAVVYPHMCGAGGDLFALVQNPDGKVVAIDSSGRAPSGADPESLRAAHGTSMPEAGPATVTVPGAVRGWQALHGQGASLRWADAFEAAVSAAADGARVSHDLAGSLARRAQELRSDPGFADSLLAGGVPAEGDLLRQPALAATLRTIAAEGADALYEGPLAGRLAGGLRAAGVPVEDADLAAHAADLVPPLRGRYRDLDVLVTPPGSQGFVLLEALTAIERLGVDPDPVGPDAVTLALILTAASADRDRHLADPETMTLHVSALLDDGHIAALCDAVRAGLGAHVGASAPGGRALGDGDTIALVAADADGWGVSLIQSLYSAFGSGVLEPATGLILHDRGACFTLQPGHPNELAPRKRPAHTLMPVAVQREGRLVALAGTRGGHGQPQIDLMALVRSFDLGLDPSDALSAPRWLVGGMSPLGDDPSVVCEADLPPAVPEGLRAAGFRIEAATAADRALGHAMLLRVEDGSLHAASDPRSDAGALAS
jgi:gamma-glutamyltranspeptidase/glutathione hydrolase